VKIKCGCGGAMCPMVMTLVQDVDGEAVYISVHRDNEATPDMVLKVKEAKKLRKYLRKYTKNVQKKEEEREQSNAQYDNAF
jgi:hypothetical protein